MNDREGASSMDMAARSRQIFLDVEEIVSGFLDGEEDGG
jgi:hypothetical protein